MTVMTESRFPSMLFEEENLQCDTVDLDSSQNPVALERCFLAHANKLHSRPINGPPKSKFPLKIREPGRKNV